MGSRNSYRGSQNSLVSLLINAVIVLLLLASILFTALGAYVSFVSTSGNGVPELFGFGLVSIQTDSMFPEFNSGDLVINQKVNDPSELNNGDIITYWTVIGSGERVLNTHRIVNIYDGGGYLIFETQGDNNNSVDAMPVHGSEIVGCVFPCAANCLIICRQAQVLLYLPQ